MKRFMAALLIMTLVGFLFAAEKVSDSGNWKLNLAKSKYNPGPAPKEIAVKIDSDADQIKVNVKGIDPEGNPIDYEFAGKYDGKDNPIKGSKLADTIALKRIDAYTTESTSKKDGKVVSKSKRTLSKDGKVITLKSTGTNPKGEKFNNIAVYEKE